MFYFINTLWLFKFFDDFQSGFRSYVWIANINGMINLRAHSLTSNYINKRMECSVEEGSKKWENTATPSKFYSDVMTKIYDLGFNRFATL